MNSEMPNEPTKQVTTGDQCAEGLQNILRDDSVQASIEKSALDDDNASIREVVDETIIEMAWARVKTNRGAPGPDGITIEDFPEWFRPRWEVVRQQLLDGTYRPEAVRRVSIDKPDGGTRELGIATVTGKSTPVQSAFGFRRNCPSVPSAV